MPIKARDAEVEARLLRVPPELRTRQNAAGNAKYRR